MFIVNFLIFSLLGLISIAVVYLFFLAAVSLLGTKNYPELKTSYGFLIIIPAHNEEEGIKQTLQYLKCIEYEGKIDIVVIADNCSDDTADVARSTGVIVKERVDKINHGKGYALEWAFSNCPLGNYDAVAVIDADTIVKPDLLKAMAHSFESGYGAVQLYYGFSAVGKTPIAYLQRIANAVENVLFYKGRSILGLPILLRGTGMAFKTDVLQKHPWDSHSITEDVDYAVKLIKGGTKIDFSCESSVSAPATSSYEQSLSQKMRWASGTIMLIRQKVLPLIFAGFSGRRFELVELAWSFFLLSRPMLIYLTLLAIVVAFVGGIGRGYDYVIWGLLLIFLLTMYLLLGIFLVPDKATALKSVIHAPYYIIWLMIVQIKALFKHDKMGWTRTKRENET